MNFLNQLYQTSRFDELDFSAENLKKVFSDLETYKGGDRLREFYQYVLSCRDSRSDLDMCYHNLLLIISKYIVLSNSEVLEYKIDRFEQTNILTPLYKDGDIGIFLCLYLKALIHASFDSPKFSLFNIGEYCVDSHIISYIAKFHEDNIFCTDLEKVKDGLSRVISDYISVFCLMEQKMGLVSQMGLSNQEAEIYLYQAHDKRELQVCGKKIISSQWIQEIRNLELPMLVCTVQRWEKQKVQINNLFKNMKSGTARNVSYCLDAINLYFYDGCSITDIVRDDLYFKPKGSPAQRGGVTKSDNPSRNCHRTALNFILGLLLADVSTHKVYVDSTYSPKTISPKDLKKFTSQVFGEYGLFCRKEIFCTGNSLVDLVKSFNGKTEESRETKFEVFFPCNILFVCTEGLTKVPVLKV